MRRIGLAKPNKPKDKNSRSPRSPNEVHTLPLPKPGYIYSVTYRPTTSGSKKDSWSTGEIDVVKKKITLKNSEKKEVVTIQNYDGDVHALNPGITMIVDSYDVEIQSLTGFIDTLPHPTQSSVSRKYEVLYRNVTNKKNKTWLGDGILLVENKKLVLMDLQEKRLEMVEFYLGRTDCFINGYICQLGNMDIEIKNEIK